MDTVAQQRSRIYRVATLAAGVFVHLLVCWTMLSLGFMSIEPLKFLGLSSLAVAGFVFFLLTVMMEWNLALEDPDMSLVQMLWTVSMVIVTSYFVEELTAVVVFSGLAMTFIGATRLSHRELGYFCVYSIALYGISVSFKSGVDSMTWLTEIAILVAVGVVLLVGPILCRFEMGRVETVLVNKNAELTTALRQIKQLAVKDELTSAFNRRYLSDFMVQQKAMADRHSYFFSLCYVDLDFFKRVNDRFGHSTGDAVLRQFADIAVQVLREIDCVARVGGEEFILVLSGTSEQDAQAAAERICFKLANLQVSQSDPNYRITASIGITAYRRHEAALETMGRADRALYEAKNNGRNRIVIADHDAEPDLLRARG